MDRQRGISTVGWILIGGLVLIAILVVLPAFTQPNGNQLLPQPQDEQVQEEQGVSVGEIKDNSDRYMGQQVTVVGEIERRVGDYGFVLDEPGVDLNNILVITPQQIDSNRQFNNDPARVSGLVAEFRINEVEQALGVDLNEQEFAGFEGEPVIIANSVELQQ